MTFKAVLKNLDIPYMFIEASSYEDAALQYCRNSMNKAKDCNLINCSVDREVIESFDNPIIAVWRCLRRVENFNANDLFKKIEGTR